MPGLSPTVRSAPVRTGVHRARSRARACADVRAQKWGRAVTTEGVAILETEVRELIRRRGIDPVRDRRGVQDLVADALADYDGRSVIGAVPPLTDPRGALKSIVDAVAGLGPLQQYLDDPEVEEIWINSP